MRKINKPLNITQIEEKLSVKLTIDEYKLLKKGGWCCQESPFCIVCEDSETALKVYEALKPYLKRQKEIIEIKIKK